MSRQLRSVGSTAPALRGGALTLIGIAWALMLAAAPAAAQGKFVKDGADAHLFRPAVDSKGYISTNGTNILGDGDYSFGLVLDAGFGIMPYHGFEYDQNASVNFNAQGVGTSGYSTTKHLVD